MSTGDVFLIALVTGAFAAAGALALVIPLRPDLLRITQRIVCPPGSSMQIRVVKLSIHRPGERGLSVVCRGPECDKDVRVRAAFWLWVMLMVPSVLLAFGVILYLAG